MAEQDRKHPADPCRKEGHRVWASEPTAHTSSHRRAPWNKGFRCLAPHFLPVHGRQDVESRRKPHCCRHLLQEVPTLLQGSTGTQEPAVPEQPLLHLPFLGVIWKQPGCGTNFLGPFPRDVVPELGQRRREAGEERGARGGEGGVLEELPGRRPHLGRPGRPCAAGAPARGRARPRGARPGRERASRPPVSGPPDAPSPSRLSTRVRTAATRGPGRRPFRRPGNHLLWGRGFRAELSRG